MGKKKVVVAGHICIDITPVFPGRPVEHLQEVLSPGKLVNVGEADIHPGGAVANTGLAMKKLGADVRLMGKVGDDQLGGLLLSLLKKEQAEQGMIVSPGTSTSYSVVLAIPGVDRIFLHHAGANNQFYCEDLNFQEIQQASLFHFGYPPVMESMYRDEGKELVAMLRKVEKMGVVTSLDMASVEEGTPAGQADWKKILKNILPFTDCFFPSYEELAFMLERERYHRLQVRAQGGDVMEFVSVEEDVKPLAEQAIRMGAAVAFVKCGARGLYYKTGSRERLRPMEDKLGLKLIGWEDREGFERSYKPDRVLSATGAGDTTIGAFLTALLEGYSLERCLQLAVATGASCVEAYDARSGLRPFGELERKIAAGWQKQMFEHKKKGQDEEISIC